MAELVDAGDLKFPALGRAGSTPASSTKKDLSGEIGRRERFKIFYFIVYGFESRLKYQS